MPSVLIVDDLISIHEMLDAVIQPTGFATAFATDGEKALTRYKAEKFDLVLADIDMKPMDGITLLKQLKQYDPSSVTIIMTAYASTESAVQALKFGAFDYLQKPFRVDELIATLRRGIEFRDIQSQRAALPAGAGIKPSDIESRIPGKSAQIKKLVQQVKKLAAVRTPVLLIGENGTGKASVAEILHGATGADESHFVRIDCALSSEKSFREGLLGQNGEGGPWVHEAKGGTLYLQHLQCLALPVQKELVSVLRNTAHAFRLVCTTTEDLEKMVDEGRFNDELFYRVASLPLQMPPLRDRKEDIPLLILDHRRRAHHHRPGLRVRLFRHPGLQGPAGGGLPRRPGQLQPGHDHDGPGVCRRHLHRAADGREFLEKIIEAGAARRRCFPRWAARRRSTCRWTCTRPGILRSTASR
jgi:two-component system response regulator HydG